MGGMRAGVVVLALVVVVAAGFVGGFFLGRDYGHQQVTKQDRERLLAELQAQQRELQQLRQQRRDEQKTATTTQIGELTFYNELPQQSVTPAPLALTPAASSKTEPARPEREPAAGIAASPAKPAAAGKFRVQVASYRGQAEAEAMRLSLHKMGIAAWVETVEIPGRGRWHRVYAGPFASLAQAEDVKARIKSALHMNGLLRKE